jgi:hypothetical protein
VTVLFRRSVAAALLLALAAGAAGAATPSATTVQRLAAVCAVDKFGQGHAAAQQALRELQEGNAADLPALLAALDRASPLAANWIRNAFETIADRELRRTGSLPAGELEAFVRDARHHPAGRRLAFEWLAKVDREAPARLIPGMLHDPGPEFRRDAVALYIGQAAKAQADGDKPVAVRRYREALAGAVHEDQVKAVAKSLDSLGEKVDIARHFAFIRKFQYIGPFDSTGGKGFAAVYPPEKEIRLDATYDGQYGPVAWTPIETGNEYGIVDIARQVKPYKGAAMYLVAQFHSPRRRALEVRIGTPNSWKLWVNGEPLFSRLEYHRGMAIDQYRVGAVMQAGRNLILLKICQDEQKPDWAQRYEFQLRVCDANGSGVLSQPAAEEGK